MRRLDELRTVTISTEGDRTIEGQMRVRGIDARAGGRGFVMERREAVSLLIREQGSLRRVVLPRARRSGTAAVWIAAPIAALIVKRLVARRRS